MTKPKWTPGPWEAGLKGEVEVGEILIYGAGKRSNALAVVLYGKHQDFNARLNDGAGVKGNSYLCFSGR